MEAPFPLDLNPLSSTGLPGGNSTGIASIGRSGGDAVIETLTDLEDTGVPTNLTHDSVLTFGPLLPALAQLQWLEELVLRTQAAQWDGVPPEWGQDHAFPRLLR